MPALSAASLLGKIMATQILPITIAEIHSLGGFLLEEHYQELTQHKEVVRLDPDWVKYYALEKAGVLMSLGAWEEGELIGYSVFFVHTHLHYKGLKTATNDVLFLRADKRLGMAGVRLIRESEKQLSKDGSVKIIWHVKYNTTLGPLLERFGYTPEEYTMGKILGEDHGI